MRRSRRLIKVLVVDDSALVRKLLGQVFSTEPEFTVEFARTGVEALAKVRDFNPDVGTLDVNMPEMDGLSCLDRIMVESPRPVVMVSSATAAGAEATLEAMRLGAVDVIAKPSGAVSLDIHEIAPKLVATVRSAAGAKVGGAVRLKDRVARRSGLSRPVSSASQQPKVGLRPSLPVEHAAGEGIVVVGVSTGGPPALEKLLEPLDEKFGWPIVIAQHMPATFTGALAKRLDRLCSLEVTEVTRMTRLEPSHVYIARGDSDIVISSRPTGLVAMPAPARKDYLWRPSVDRLVRTAMDTLHAKQLLGVMLTGMGSDGSKAMADLKAAGGRTIAESEESAVVWGMPGELVKAGGADWVAPVSEIGALLNKLVLPCP
jgi:two-component system, chemotaxis family, protein-glutamate methylesterase/glutaminase